MLHSYFLNILLLFIYWYCSTVSPFVLLDNTHTKEWWKTTNTNSIRDSDYISIFNWKFFIIYEALCSEFIACKNLVLCSGNFFYLNQSTIYGWSLIVLYNYVIYYFGSIYSLFKMSKLYHKTFPIILSHTLIWLNMTYMST